MRSNDEWKWHQQLYVEELNEKFRSEMEMTEEIMKLGIWKLQIGDVHK